VASKQQQRRARGAAPAGRPTKAERREMARRQRDELRRKAARARRNRRVVIWAIVAAVIAGGVWFYTSDSDGNGSEARGVPLPGMMTGTAPWPANLDQLGSRLDRLDLPPFSSQVALHKHSHLDLFVNGASVPVPADIGWAANAQSALHTHDDAGVIHLESGDANARFTLGEFFDVWGVRLSPTCLGGYCEQGDKSLHVFVDGEPITEDPRQIELTDQSEITIAYGTDEEVPDPLPTFDWSQLQP
jgi:hypothetical protein